MTQRYALTGYSIQYLGVTWTNILISFEVWNDAVAAYSEEPFHIPFNTVTSHFVEVCPDQS
jgi:hypothetical protein